MTALGLAFNRRYGVGACKKLPGVGFSDDLHLAIRAMDSGLIRPEAENHVDIAIAIKVGCQWSFAHQTARRTKRNCC